MKYAFIQTHQQHHSIQTLCKYLGVSRSGYYSWLSWKPGVRLQQNNKLTTRIRDIHVRTELP